eukprot:11224887-Lingulodinium_polyedra.AAC.1
MGLREPRFCRCVELCRRPSWKGVSTVSGRVSPRRHCVGTCEPDEPRFRRLGSWARSRSRGCPPRG